MTFPVRSWAHQADTLSNYRTWNAAMRAEQEARRSRGEPEIPPMIAAELCAAGTTDGNGAFAVLVEVPWSQTYRGGRACGPADPPPRDGVEVLRVEPKDGSAAVTLDVPP